MKKEKGRINFLVENRYKISLILLIALTIFQYFFILKGNLTSEIFNGNILNNKLFMSFYSSFKFLSLLLVSYELCYIITNNKKGTSIIGTIIITFSTVVQTHFSNILIEILILGQLTIILLNKFMISEKFRTRIVCLLGITATMILYFFTYFSAYMVSLGYVFFALAIWVVIKNIKNTHITKKEIVFIVLCVALIVGACIWYIQISSKNLIKLQGNIENSENKINGLGYLFSYLYNFLLPFKNIEKSISLTNIISVFPIPMIIALYYIYKKENHFSFLLPMSIVAVLETVFCISGFPVAISKITFLQNTTIEIMSVGVGFANFYLLLYMLSNIDEELVSMKASIRITIALMCIIIFIPLPEQISSRGYLSLISGILCIYTFLFLNNYDKKYSKVLLFFITIFTLIGGLFIK